MLRFLVFVLSLLTITHLNNQVIAQTLCPAIDLSAQLSHPISVSIPYETAYLYHYITASSKCSSSNQCNLIALLDCNEGDDADLFLITVPTFDPQSMQCYDWQNAQMTSDEDGANALVVPNMIAGTTYVIYEQAWSEVTQPGRTPAQCTLLVEIERSSDPSQVPLTPGIPQQGVITPVLGQFQYYRVDVPSGATLMTVTLTAKQGQPSLSIQPGPSTVPIPYEAQYNTSLSASNLLTVTNPSNGTWSIFVRESDSAALAIFYVTVSFISGSNPNLGAQQLPEGSSLSGRLRGNGEVNYFYYTMSANGFRLGYSLTIDLDVISFGADAGLYVSLSNITSTPTSSPGGYLWKADSFDSDSLTINPTDPHFCAGCDYTIAVIARTSGVMSYSIVAHSSRTQTIREGETITSTVRQLAYRYYQYVPERCDGEQLGVTFSIQPITGSVFVYINTQPKFYPTMQNSSWSMNESIGGRDLTIRPSDAPFACIVGTGQSGLNNCSYVIGIMGHSAPTDSSSIQFSFSASTRCSSSGSGGNNDNNIVRQPALRDGSSTSIATIAKDAWIYYQVVIDDATLPDLVISMTVFGGDPDFYYRYSRYGLITDLPTLFNHDGAADGEGNDTMLIPDAQQGTYFIGVNGWTAGQFSLAVHTYNNTAILIDGRPQSNIVTFYSPSKYTFYVPSDNIARMTLSLFRVIGDPDVYIAFNQTISRPYDNPSYNSTNAATGGTIVIDYPKKGPYMIVVVGNDVEPSFYTITMTTDDASSKLMEGRAVSGRIDRASMTNDYYVYSLSRYAGALTFALTVFDGDCDLYISTLSHTPNSTNYDSNDTTTNWAATSYGSDSITIPQNNLVIGDYYVGVSAYSTCSYRLLVSLNQSILLEDGGAQTGVVPKDGGQYYRLVAQNTGPFTLLITATPIAGTVVLYVALNKPDLTKSNSQWHSNSWEATPRLSINNTGCAVRCVYYILVSGGSPSGGSYSLVASIRAQGANPGVATQLINGISTTGQLAADTYAYFYFRDSEAPNSTVIFTVTPDDQGSDPDLDVSSSSLVQQPTRLSQSTKHGSTSGADVVTFDFTENLYNKDGQYWIGVYASSSKPTSFSVLAQTIPLNGSLVYTAPVPMVLSQPKTGFVSVSDKSRNAQYYSYTVQERTDLTVQMTARYGDPDIYIKFVPANLNKPSMPNSTYKDYSSTGSTGDTIIIPSENVCDDKCVMLISVVAFTNSLYNLLITSATNSTVIPLLAGQSQTSYVQADVFKYYYVTVYSGQSVTIVLTSISGDPDIYVRTSTDNTKKLPLLDLWDQRSTDSGSDLLTIAVTQWPTTVFIGIRGYYAASFSLLAYIGAQQLLPAQPQVGMLGPNDLRYYSVDYYPTGTVITPLSFNLIVNSAAAVADFCVGYGYQPSVGHCNQTVTGQSITISNPVKSVRYFLMLKARSAIDYTIIAQYNSAPIIITANHAIPGSLSGGQYRYYHAYVSDPSKDVSIDIVRSFGEVRVIVSDYFVVPEPKINGANIIADTSPIITERSGHITLDVSGMALQQNSAHQNVLVIAVYSVGSSEYSITYSTAAKALVLGTVQPGSTNKNNGFDYFLVSPPLRDSVLTLTLRGIRGDGGDDYYSIATYTVYSCHSSETNCVTNIDIAHAQRSPTMKNGDNYVIPVPTGGSTHTGVYRLAIQTSLPVNFSVIANVQGSSSVSQQLSVGLTLISETTLTSAPRYYSVNLQRIELSNIVVSTCKGEGTMITSVDTPNPTSQTGNAVTVELNPTDAEAKVAITSNTGRIYASVVPRDEGNPFIYDITYRPWIPRSDPQATYAYLTMDEQKITTTPTSDGFIVHYQTARVRTDLSEPVIVRYTIYYTDQNDVANIHTVCGCQLIVDDDGQPKNRVVIPVTSSALDELEDRSYTVTGVPHGRYKVNVVATPAREFTDSTSVSDIGKPETAADVGINTGEGGYSGNVIAAVVIPVLIFVCAVIFYLWRKTRKLQAELTGVEMQEAPRSAVLKAMNGAAFRRKAAQFAMKVPRPGSNFKRYNTLLTLGENEDSRNHIEFQGDNELGWDENYEESHLDDGNAYSLDSLQEAEFEAQQRELSVGPASHEYHEHQDLYK